MPYCRDRCYERKQTQRVNTYEDEDDEDQDEPVQDYNYGGRRDDRAAQYGPVLMDLDGRQRMAKNMSRANDINSNQNILMRENPDIFRAAPRAGTQQPENYQVQVQRRNSQMGRDRAKVKNVTSNANILSEKNPDIFATPPRPGGFLKISPRRTKQFPSDFAEICERCTSVYEHEVKLQTSKLSQASPRRPSKPSIHPVSRETESREFRIRRALEESDWETTVIDETDTVVGISNPYHLGMNMLAVTITCIMMMASKITATLDYYEWAETYLQCIKDENNKSPRNIAGILKEIEKDKANAEDPSYKDNNVPGRPRQPGQPGQPGQGRGADAPRRNDRGCRVTCSTTTRQGKPGTCTTTSSCTMNKNLCAAIRMNPCPNMKMPKCDVKCGHITTIDDFVSPTPSQRDKKHV